MLVFPTPPLPVYRMIRVIGVHDGAMSMAALRAERTDVELLDAGEGRRLERFGRHVVDRPAPSALAWRRDLPAWEGADLRFDPAEGWSTGKPGGEAGEVSPWPVEIGGLTMELRPTASGGLGLYAEHVANLAWLEARIGARREAAAGGAMPTVLNLFAHTGLATLAAARAGAAIAHVDGARTAIAWARRNAELSDLADRPIRWLVDDAASFVAREARRSRRYDGIVLDPPSFGHAGKRRWRLEDELPDLLAGCAAILASDGFVLLTAHTEGLDGPSLEELASAAFPSPAAGIETAPLELVAVSGARLALGWSVRINGR
jgi:23S rRNA (cytosine1962-C5)-methyltransferase